MTETVAVVAPAPARSGDGARRAPANAEAAIAAGVGGTGVELSQVYSEHYRSLVRFLYRQTGDQALAEDLAQEAFVRAIEHQPEQPKAWLFQVAANLARDDFRRRAVRRRHLELVREADEGVAARGDDAARPDVALERDQAATQVRAALEALSVNDRDGLLLREEGLSYDEIAAVLNISKSSVGTTLSRARSRFAEAYERITGAGSQTDAAH